MARNMDVRYVQFYTDGSAARKLEPVAPARPKPARPAQKRRRKRITIYVDPAAVLGIVVSFVMLICIVSGIFVMNRTAADAAAMEKRVAELTLENAELRERYAEGYDLEAIGAEARGLGMVPRSSVEHRAISVYTEQDVRNTRMVSDFLSVLTDLFA